MRMSPMQLAGIASAALLLMLAVFEVLTRLSDRHKIKTGQVEDQSLKNTWLKKYNPVPHTKTRIWCEGLLIVATGAACVVWFGLMYQYDHYGAFYDESWREPDVASHFLFTSEDTKDLDVEYGVCLDTGTEYDFAKYNVVLVKLGCEDCERVQDSIEEFQKLGYKVVFSRSDVGKAYVEHYGITYVPSVVYAGTVVELRSGSSGYTDGSPAGSPSEEIGSQVGSLEDLLKGSDYDGPRTKTEAENWDEMHPSGDTEPDAGE